MATSEPRLAVKQSLTPSELDDVGALVREARWNQLAADWRIFIEFGRLYAIHSDAGRIIANLDQITIAACGVNAVEQVGEL